MKKNTKKEVSTPILDISKIEIKEEDKLMISDIIKTSVMEKPVFDPTIMYRVGNLAINKFSLEQIKRAIAEKDYDNSLVLDFLELFLKEAEKNQEEYKQPVEKINYTPSANPKVKQKEIKYVDSNSIDRYMLGDIIGLHDEISKDGHIKRILRILLTAKENTNIDVPVGSLITTADQRFAIIKRLSEFVYEITEYVR